jgi:predicted DsbA family dithiol-disulfide isomerase
MNKNLLLYRTFLKTAKKFKDYNIQSYIIRVAKEDFHKNKDVKDEKILHKLREKAKLDLELLERQQTIANLYESKPSILKKGHSS